MNSSWKNSNGYVTELVINNNNWNDLFKSLNYEDINVLTDEHKVFRDKTRIKLGPTEYRLLVYLMENPRRVFSREQLLDAVWGREVYVESRTVDTHIRRLRKAINIEGTKNLIRTVRASGYSLDND